MKRCFLLFLLFITISGCQQGESNTDSSPIIGTWITEECSQMSTSDDNLLNIWCKGEFQFYPSGAIVQRIQQYSDSNCSAASGVIDQFDETTTPFSFQDLGAETLQEGIEGRRIIVSIQFDGNDSEGEGFYTITNGTLCLSHNIILGPFYAGVSSSQSTINFEKCLSKMDSP